MNNLDNNILLKSTVIIIEFRYPSTIFSLKLKGSDDESAYPSSDMTVSDQVMAWFTIWKRSRFFNVRTEGFVSIAIFLEKEPVNLRKCVQIVLGILKSLNGLHARGISQRYLALDDVFVKNRSVSFL